MGKVLPVYQHGKALRCGLSRQAPSVSFCQSAYYVSLLVLAHTIPKKEPPNPVRVGRLSRWESPRLLVSPWFWW